MTKPVILIGGFSEIVEICELSNREIVGIVDGAYKGEYLGYPILGTDADVEALSMKYKDAEIFLTPDSPTIRRKLYDLYSRHGFSFATLIHPSVLVSKSAIVEQGVVLQAGVSVSANSNIGAFVKINSCANVTHDVTVGDFSTIAPSAVVLSNSQIGEGCYIGANATVLPNRTICDGAVVGAGAVVTKNVDSKLTVMGNPADVKENIN